MSTLFKSNVRINRMNPKGELISQKSGRRSTFQSQPHLQPLLFDAKYPLTSKNSPPYTSTPQKQCLIQDLAHLIEKKKVSEFDKLDTF